eukprot:TRINITY_DN844_c0_g2_i1.p1 TRINITY_DN844_c0_g2~~TRINITY_DN844_c0_g2_i1.p1  ORF type:complete len:230 (+),score=29.23 TRINITY_DN844_c0_g2_i1:79-690(+)
MTEINTSVPPLVGVMKDYNMQEFPEDYVNPRGLPRIEFFENAAEYCKAQGGATAAAKKLNEMFSKFKVYEYKMHQNKESLLRKIPEITKTIEMVKHLKAKQDSDEVLEAHYELSDVVYAAAIVDKPKRVGLWLGASVMVEYSLDEAIALLSKNLASAQENMENILQDIAWIRDQTNICEVNQNRIYNHTIMEKRAAKEAAEKK